MTKCQPRASGFWARSQRRKAAKSVGASGAELPEHRSAGDAQGRDEHAGTMADVLGLALFDMTRSRQSRRRLALEGLDARLLIDRDSLDAGFGTLGRQAIDLAHVVTALGEALIALGVQPGARAVRLEVRLFLKKRPTESGEIEATMPRLSASSANSWWVQCVIGRSLSAGGSQAIATIAQICSCCTADYLPGNFSN